MLPSMPVAEWRMSLSDRDRRLARQPLPLTDGAEDPAGGAADRPSHHTTAGFRNPPGSGPARGGNLGAWTSFLYRRTFRRAAVAVPEGHVLPGSEAMDGVFNRRSDADRLTWLGHSSFLVRLDGLNILTDPFLTDYASPVPPFGPKRFAPPGLPPAQLPPIDLLLLSHNHYDHLDLRTLEALAGKDRIEVVVPLRLARYFEERGYRRVHELDWHQELALGEITIRALPAIHFSERSPFDRNRTLWTGYAIEGRSKRVYFAGDTAYGPVFQELGRSGTPFDLALLPIGAYEPRALMRAGHVTPEEAVAIGGELHAKRLVGMHWGAIQLTDEAPFEPPGRFRTAASAAGYDAEDAWVMRVGETRAI
jgi:N-acyl-phosphatidylethanolamine-hydrolysing phospholipase D